MKNIKARDFFVKLLTVLLIVVLSVAFTACNKAQGKQLQSTEEAQQPAEQKPDEAQQTEAEQKPDEAQQPEAEQKSDEAQQPEAEQKSDEAQQPAEQKSDEAQQPAEQKPAEQPTEQTEEERLAAYVESLVDVDPEGLIDELLRVKSEEEDSSYQQAVIDRLMQEKTSQKSPCMAGEYPIVRVFNGFVMVGDDGKVIAYEDAKHLHFVGDWKDVKRNGSVTFEENAVIWRTDGVTPQWSLAEHNGTRYLFYKITWDDVDAGDSVYTGYDKHVRQCTKAVVTAVKEDGVVSEKNYNLLESIAFQTARKPVSSEEYCIVQYLTREVCGRYDLSGRTLINLKVDENGELKKVDTSSPSLIILEEDLGIKVTIVTEETEEGVQFEETNK